jgi:hypothetical protein
VRLNKTYESCLLPKRDPPTASDVASCSHALLDLEAKLLPNRSVEASAAFSSNTP